MTIDYTYRKLFNSEYDLGSVSSEQVEEKILSCKWQDLSDDEKMVALEAWHRNTGNAEAILVIQYEEFEE